jgi:hypothetical protein
MTIDYYFSFEAGQYVASILQNWTIIVYGFALMLGGLSLFIYNMRALIKMTPGKWWYSFCIIAGFLITLVAGLIPPITQHPLFTWIYNYWYQPQSGTLFGMVAFFIVSVAYRAVKIRNLHSAVFALCAFFMILNQAPITSSFTDIFFNVGNWITKVLSTSGWRAFYIGSAIGTVALAVRIFIWRERGIMGE